MIELPSTRSLSIKDGKNVVRVKAVSDIDTSSECIDVIYDIVATVQIICTKMNSYFGKKVKIENFEKFPRDKKWLEICRSFSRS